MPAFYKKLECIIEKLRFIHLLVPGGIRRIYYIQQALIHASPKKAYLSNSFHNNITYWNLLLHRMQMQPTYLVETVHRTPTDIGFTNASVIVSAKM